jgi:hypothetical protein
VREIVPTAEIQTIQKTFGNWKRVSWISHVWVSKK